MANQICKFCDQEPAAFLISELSSGDTVYIGLLCLPPFCKTVWDDSGMPGLVIDIVEPDAIDTTGQTDAAPVVQAEVDRLADEGEPFPATVEAAPEAVNGHTEVAETAAAADDHG